MSDVGVKPDDVCCAGDTAASDDYELPIPALVENPANPKGPPIHDPDTGNDTHLL